MLSSHHMLFPVASKSGIKLEGRNKQFAQAKMRGKAARKPAHFKKKDSAKQWGMIAIDPIVDLPRNRR